MFRGERPLLYEYLFLAERIPQMLFQQFSFVQEVDDHWLKYEGRSKPLNVPWQFSGIDEEGGGAGDECAHHGIDMIAQPPTGGNIFG